MSSWTTVVTPVATLVGGAGFAELVRAWHSRGRGEAENRRDDAMASNYIADAAAKLLEPYLREVGDLRDEVKALKDELESDRCEQARVTSLLQQSIQVIKEFLDIARGHKWAAPSMSPELLAEIERQK